ncbi:putative toxin-antitoxin system toxin component, PIN family [Melaminivora suipulveris]|uniref:Putative toxin-antitoxin system toxin component, PIN family n=1 Tax=Melaminivora suipulveris TaxID=2109913 RepID=A0A2R3QBD0_9BURK|nr:putative toxin-antitoxin system toxin component, PIN family [Melaminivora suipulveris]AVO49090.1 putative toxin-antitoxin system toxin component, PIN family [Melaminivora suipulveris]
MRRPELRLSLEPAAGEAARPVVLDSNIVLDLLLFADPAAAPLRALLAAGRLRWIATQAMRDELACVLAYPHLQARLALAGCRADQVLAAFDAGAQLLPAAARAQHACKDPDDQKFIDLAVAQQALLLSKDKAVLCMRKRLEASGTQAGAAIVLEAAA